MLFLGAMSCFGGEKMEIDIICTFKRYSLKLITFENDEFIKKNKTQFYTKKSIFLKKIENSGLDPKKVLFGGKTFFNFSDEKFKTVEFDTAYKFHYIYRLPSNENNNTNESLLSEKSPDE